MNNTIDNMINNTGEWDQKRKIVLVSIREAYRNQDNLKIFLECVKDSATTKSNAFLSNLEKYRKEILTESEIQDLADIIINNLPESYLGDYFLPYIPRSVDVGNLDIMSEVLSDIISRLKDLHHSDMMIKVITNDMDLDSAIAQLSAISENNLLYPYFDLSYDEPKIWRPYDVSNTVWVLETYKKMKRFGYLFIQRFFSRESLYSIDSDLGDIPSIIRRNYKYAKLTNKAYYGVQAEYEKYHIQLDAIMSNDVKSAFTSQKSLWYFSNMEEDMYGSLPYETRSLLATPHNDLQYWIAQLSNIATGQSRNEYAKLKVSHMLNINTLYAPIVYAYNAMNDDEEEE